MRYKTIAMELLEIRPKIHARLREKRLLLQTITLCAKALRERHRFWQQSLAKADPIASQSMIETESLELAIKDLENLLPDESLHDDRLSFLEVAMASFPASPA